MKQDQQGRHLDCRYTINVAKTSASGRARTICDEVFLCANDFELLLCMVKERNKKTEREEGQQESETCPDHLVCPRC